MVLSALRLSRAALLAAGLGVFVLWGGLGCRNDGPSDYEKMQQARQGAASTLASVGAKLEEKQYPLGRAWVVNLSGKPISDDLLRQVKGIGNVAELDLSKTTVNDEQLKLMHELGLHVLLFRLDLGKTAVTDAGLEHLDGCIFLSQLNLYGTKVTPGAVERFKQKRQQDPRVRLKTTTVQL